jgi:hypothetical protein
MKSAKIASVDADRREIAKDLAEFDRDKLK